MFAVSTIQGGGLANQEVDKRHGEDVLRLEDLCLADQQKLLLELQPYSFETDSEP